MTKAKVITKSGTKITIDGSSAEVKEIIDFIEGKKETQSTGKITAKKKILTEKKKRNTATDIILSFREDGFFNKPRTLLDIKKALEEEGMIYPITTLSAIILGQVRKRNLGRVKENKKWCYVKR